jgi:hypothetical protein
LLTPKVSLFVEEKADMKKSARRDYLKITAPCLAAIHVGGCSANR